MNSSRITPHAKRSGPLHSLLLVWPTSGKVKMYQDLEQGQCEMIATAAPALSEEAQYGKGAIGYCLNQEFGSGPRPSWPQSER